MATLLILHKVGEGKGQKRDPVYELRMASNSFDIQANDHFLGKKKTICSKGQCWILGKSNSGIVKQVYQWIQDFNSAAFV